VQRRAKQIIGANHINVFAAFDT